MVHVKRMPDDWFLMWKSTVVCTYKLAAAGSVRLIVSSEYIGHIGSCGCVCSRVSDAAWQFIWSELLMIIITTMRWRLLLLQLLLLQLVQWTLVGPVPTRNSAVGKFVCVVVRYQFPRWRRELVGDKPVTSRKRQLSCTSPMCLYSLSATYRTCTVTQVNGKMGRVYDKTQWQLGDDLAWNLNVPRGHRSGAVLF